MISPRAGAENRRHESNGHSTGLDSHQRHIDSPRRLRAPQIVGIDGSLEYARFRFFRSSRFASWRRRGRRLIIVSVSFRDSAASPRITGSWS
jgi:hypothetical protein